MNLVAFSIKTQGLHNFARRLWTVFTRFGVSETKTKIALQTVIDSLRITEPSRKLRRHSTI